MAEADHHDVKPKLNLTVVYNEASMRVQVKANTSLKKVFDAAYKRFNLAPGTIRFNYQGVRLRDEETPMDHEMEDDDQIDAQVAQVGGGLH